ncbi:MAG: hypothetical protein HY236_08145 [Acidobacteria bacterium]|nr:hypothetical protein [Acidobacteriota bacterium]
MTPHRSDAEAFARLLEPTLLRVHHANTLDHAGELLRATQARVLVAETTSSDGNWKDILGWLETLHPKVALVLTNDQADARLWSEILHYGAYDLIPKPFHAPEVCRILRGAERHAVSGDARFVSMAS